MTILYFSLPLEWPLALILFILMIVFAVKLIHRNQELDDLYDEYDIPLTMRMRLRAGEKVIRRIRR